MKGGRTTLRRMVWAAAQSLHGGTLYTWAKRWAAARMYSRWVSCGAERAPWDTGSQAHVSKGCLYCHERAEQPGFAPRWGWRCLFSSSHKSTCALFPAVPLLTRGHGQTGSPRQAVTIWHPLYPGTGSALPLLALSLLGDPTALLCTHIFRVECQWMGTAPVPRPEGDTRAGFLAQGRAESGSRMCPPG